MSEMVKNYLTHNFISNDVTVAPKSTHPQLYLGTWKRSLNYQTRFKLNTAFSEFQGFLKNGLNFKINI